MIFADIGFYCKTPSASICCLCFRAKVRISKDEVTRQTTKVPHRVRMVSCVFESSPSLVRSPPLHFKKTLIGTPIDLKGPMNHSVRESFLAKRGRKSR